MKLRPNKYTARAKHAAYNEASRPTIKEPLLATLDRKIEELLNYVEKLPSDDDTPSSSSTESDTPEPELPFLLTPWQFHFEDLHTAEFYGAALGTALYQRSFDRLISPSDVAAFLEKVYNRGEIERYTCKECLGDKALPEMDVGLLVEVQAEGECAHWNEITLGFLGRMGDSLWARVGLALGES